MRDDDRAKHMIHWARSSAPPEYLDLLMRVESRAVNERATVILATSLDLHERAVAGIRVLQRLSSQ